VYRRLTSLTSILALSLLSPICFAQQTTGRAIANSTPRFVVNAKKLGAENPAKVIDVTVWLRRHNSAALHQLVGQLYDKNSPNYHRWVSPASLNAQFAPKVEESQTVRKFLESRNLTVTTIAGNNSYVRARGRIADIQKAFHVQIARFQTQDGVRRANTSDPWIEEPAASLVSAVSGLHDGGYSPALVRPVDPATGTAYQPVPLGSVSIKGAFFESQCFRGIQIQGFQTNNTLPSAIYLGNRYGADISNSQMGHLAPCGYGPAEVQTAYKLNGLYNKHLDGTGQTVVIVDAFGSPTIQDDVALFSAYYGLPPADLTVICGPTGCPTVQNDGWAGETTLDVEWAHVVAPGAKIILIQAADNYFDTLNAAVQYAIDNQLGTTISNSYSAPEVVLDSATLDVTNGIIESGAAAGISVNYSSGDNGDWNAILGVNSADFPASSPWATSIGGTSLALNSDNTMKFQTGWGTHETRIADRLVYGNPPDVPPIVFGFIYGSGGGDSVYFAKPAFQSALPGSFRRGPDISYLADPFTGVEIIRTPVGGSGPVVEVIGGTSLACPMFSGMWAIASQKAGGFLGQAAQLVYSLPSKAVTDVTAYSSPTNVRGAIVTGTTNYVESPAALVAPLQNTKKFYSAMYNSPFSTRWFVLGFGLDSSLTTGRGWDNVTGVGTPNGLAFVNAVAAASH